MGFVDPVVVEHLLPLAAVVEGVAAGQVELEFGGVAQFRNVARLEGCQQQAEAGDRNGEGVDVHAVNRVERPLHQFADVGARILFLPAVQDPRETPQ
ncbi:MAG: hypothetical protein CME32_26495 [Gimesia sp.]|nr:hypothetical protein [Gimesia sp.]